MTGTNTMPRKALTDLAGCQDASDFADDGFITAQICPSVEDETKVIHEVISLVFSSELGWETDDSIPFCGARHQTPAQSGGWDDIL